MNRILVIDDEPNISDLIHEILTRFGYAVETADDGRQGLRRLKEARFDLIVTDMYMPGLDGSAILRHVRGSRRPLTPVIGISGTPWLLEGEDFDAVLPKPFHLQQLIDTVKRLDSISLPPPSAPKATALSLNA